MKNTTLYFYNTYKEFRKKKKIRIIVDSFRHLKKWKKTMKNKDFPTSLDEFVPWMNFNVISFLEKYLRNDMQVFEWGSGNSTVFLSQRVNHVISIEHNKEWYYKIIELIQKSKIANVDYKLIEPTEISKFDAELDFMNPSHYYSKDQEYSTKRFKEYVLSIDNYPDKSFDLIIIDGRARPSCLLHAFKKIKDSGYILLDNTERKRYLESIEIKELLTNCIVKEYVGHTPFLYEYFNTTIIRKR